MKLFLASSSPRRAQLLKEAGFEFQASKPEVAEIKKRGESPTEMVKRLAIEKSAWLGHREGLWSSVVVIGSDTTVVAPGGRRVLEKPKDAAESQRMLKSLSGKWHTVLTGYSIQEWKQGRKIKTKTVVIRTLVQFRKLLPEEISAYIDSGEPADKAGAYGAQGKGMSFILQVKGSYSSVIGFPIAQIADDLKRLWKILPNTQKASS